MAQSAVPSPVALHHDGRLIGRWEVAPADPSLWLRIDRIAILDDLRWLGDERPRLARPASSSARALQRATLVGADHLVLEALEEELPTAARAKRLIRLVPDRGLAADGRVCGPQLVQRGTTGGGRYEDLPEPVSTEIAVKLSTNSHRRPPPGNTPRTVPWRSFVPLPANWRSRSVNWGTPGAGKAGPGRRLTAGRKFGPLKRHGPGRRSRAGPTNVRRGGLGCGLGGLDFQGDQGIRVGQVGELADHPAGDDVEVVVAVILAFVGHVVVTNDHDVLGRVFPEHPAGELP